MTSKNLESRVEIIKMLVAERLTREEIAERLGMGYNTLASYLFKYPEIPKPIRKKNGPRDLEKYERIKILIGKGLNQSEISQRFGMSRQAINFYINYYPELKKIYDSYKRIKNDS